MYQAVFDSKDKTVLTVSADWTGKLWDLTQINAGVPVQVATLQHKGPVYQGAFDPATDSRATTASNDHTLKVWDLSAINSGVVRLVATMTHDGSVTGFVYNPNGTKLVSLFRR